MSYISKFRDWLNGTTETKSSAPTFTTTSGWENFLAYGPTISGANVSPETAMRVPAVKAAVELIATTVGTLPVKVYRHLDDGGKEVANDHIAYRLAHDDANAWTSATAFRAALTCDALLHGNGYAAVTRSFDGRPLELIRLSPRAVTVETDEITGEPRYRVSLATNGQRIYPYTEIIHIVAPCPRDGITGVAPITTCREAVGLSLILEQHAAQLFGNGARPSGTLSFPGVLAGDALERIKTSWSSAHSGNRAGGTAILESDGKWQPLAFSSVDSEFSAMRQFQLGEIARAFRVPPAFLMDYSRATWSNSEQMARQLVDFTLKPWLDAWESAYRRVLLSDDDRTSYSIEFVLDELLKGDTAARAAAYAQFRSAGVYTANEIRALENLPSRPDGDELGNPYTSATTGPTSNSPAPTTDSNNE